MNETRSNSRTKPMREPFKEREINSLKDSEKTNESKYNKNNCSMCIYGHNLATHFGYPYYEYIPGCLKKFLWFYIQQNPKKCKKFKQKGGYKL